MLRVGLEQNRLSSAGRAAKSRDNDQPLGDHIFKQPGQAAAGYCEMLEQIGLRNGTMLEYPLIYLFFD
ncbi:hypothetical protein D3C75_323460 [compost metagenome]